MEQKKVQRIIGIVVVIVLVIVIMPLLFGKNNFPVQEAANIKAPPFPEPQQAVAETTAPATPAPAAMASPVAAPVSEQKTVTVTPEMAKKVQDDSAAAATAAANAAIAHSSSPENGTVIYEAAPASTAPAATAIAPPAPAVATTPPPAVSASVPVQPLKTAVVTHTLPQKNMTLSAVAKHKVIAVKINKNHARQVKLLHAKVAIDHFNAHSDAYSNTKKTGWAVQLGNFAIKHNAVHLANLLQAAGYKVFTRDIQSTSGKKYTRVYIGPEFRQASAVRLSTEVYTKLSFKGFVVPYSKISA